MIIVKITHRKFFDRLVYVHMCACTLPHTYLDLTTVKNLHPHPPLEFMRYSYNLCNFMYLSPWCQ